jgi:hypothetical protein
MSGNGTSRSFDSPDSRLPNDPFLDKMQRGSERMEQSFDRLMNSIADLRAAMCEGFAEMHRRFDRLDQLHQGAHGDHRPDRGAVGRGAASRRSLALAPYGPEVLPARVPPLKRQGATEQGR